MRQPLLTLLLACVGLAACAPPASQGSLDSDNPAAKLYAIRRIGEAHDRSQIPGLVEQLDHDDPAVRLFAIEALERMTGTRLGYNPYASPPQRRPAVEAWVQAVREGRFGR